MTGAQVVELREALHMSPRELARALNVGARTLAGWEKEGPHGLGFEVLSGLHAAVFRPLADAAEIAARADRIATELRLGIGALLMFRILDYVQSEARP